MRYEKNDKNEVRIYDENNYLIFTMLIDGYWEKYDYDQYGKHTFLGSSHGVKYYY